MRTVFRNTILAILLIISNSNRAIGQDSTVVFQEKTSLFSNQYIFFSNGTFKHFFYTDDGQVWYGAGTYKDQSRNRVLQFADADTTFESGSLLIRHESNFNRILKKRGKKFRSDDFYHTTRKRKVIFSQKNWGK